MIERWIVRGGFSMQKSLLQNDVTMHELSPGKFSSFFWKEFYDFLGPYQSSASLNVLASLNLQIISLYLHLA